MTQLKSTITVTSLAADSQYLQSSKWWAFAIDGPRVVGMLSVVHHENWLWLNDLFVAPNDRKRGIGKSLVDWSITEATKQWAVADGIACGIRSDNHASRCLFCKCGFRDCGRQHPVFGVPTGCVIYSRRFTETP